MRPYSVKSISRERFMVPIQPLHPLFAARVTDIDDDIQVAFRERFGRLETTRAAAKTVGGKLIVLTNLDAAGRSCR